MGFNFRPVDRDQLYLFPPSLRDWLPEDHLVWFLLDVVDQMDLSAFSSRYRSDGWGGQSYDPSMMVALLLYAYCLGERSSRRIEQLCRENIAFRVITANQVPDHATIARFRQRHEEDLRKLFIEALRLCQKAGLVKVETVIVDGTKIRANASPEANQTYEHIREQVERMLEEAKVVDKEEDRRAGQGPRGGGPAGAASPSESAGAAEGVQAAAGGGSGAGHRRARGKEGQRHRSGQPPDEGVAWIPSGVQRPGSDHPAAGDRGGGGDARWE